MPETERHYKLLPRQVRDNLSYEQWQEAQPGVIADGQPAPETTEYINLKNATIRVYQQGERAAGPLLPVHDLAGARGQDDTQFLTSPPGAHGVP